MIEGTSEQQVSSRIRWRVFLLVTAGVFLSTMDSSMVNVALPSIMRSFSTTLIQTQWVVLMYLLTITVSLLFWGISADHVGSNRVYLAGVAIFSFASVCCSQAPGLSWLIGFRFVEGLGAAMMMSAGPALIRDVFPRSSLGKALGLVGIATSAGLMSGPVVSGFLISSYSWRAIFLVTVPVGVFVLLAGFSVLMKNNVLSPPGKTRQLDWKGAFFWATLISSIIVYAHYLPSLAVQLKIAGLLLLVLLTALFVWSEKTRKSTLLPLHLFARNYYHIGLITAALSFATLFVVLILMPFYLDYIKGVEADMIGLVMMAVPVTLFVASPTAGSLYDRFGSRYLTTGGLLLCCVALLLLSQLQSRTTLIDIGWRLSLLGLGQSVFLAPNTASLLSRGKDSDAALTSGLLATSRNLGMLFGAAFAGIVFAAWFGYFSGGAELGDYYPVQAQSFIRAFRSTLLCTALFSLAAACISWQRER
ncbi:MAG: MFS transporter [Desulfocapsaceae bacterium]|jgi:EmrB/QacA subfamily drug resistance transporter|nr:MFS transporter [Desulfocapsaceae bacterium]